MIALNIKKPRNCAECFYGLRCKAVPNWLTIDQEIPHDCPLIEIADTEWEWCHDCKEYDREKNCCHRWTNKIRDTVAELEEHYGKYINKHGRTLIIDYPDTDNIQVIRLLDDEGFTRVFEERRSDEHNTERD